MVALASARACRSSPACSCSAPQQRGRRGACTSKPSAASTRAVARVHVAEEHALHAALEQRDRRRASRPRRRALGQARERAASTPPGSSAASAASRGARPAHTRPAREAGQANSARAPPGRQRAQAPGRVNSSKISRRCAVARPAGAQLRSTCARVSSISLSYCTPDGQAVTHAMQPRQWSRCATSGAEISSWPSFISTIRPRGESISSPQSDVGRAGGQAEAAVHAVVDQARGAAGGVVDGVEWSIARCLPNTPGADPAGVEALLHAPHQRLSGGADRGPTGRPASTPAGRSSTTRRPSRSRSASTAPAVAVRQRHPPEAEAGAAHQRAPEARRRSRSSSAGGSEGPRPSPRAAPRWPVALGRPRAASSSSITVPSRPAPAHQRPPRPACGRGRGAGEAREHGPAPASQRTSRLRAASTRVRERAAPRPSTSGSAAAPTGRGRLGRERVQPHRQLDDRARASRTSR